MLTLASALVATAGHARGICRAVDGDTLRCGQERIRLIGIDAPEMPGHCRSGRRCVAGDPLASRKSLQRALGGPIIIERIGHDRYGRTLAFVSAGGQNLSCDQLQRGQAHYRADWDFDGRIGRC